MKADTAAKPNTIGIRGSMPGLKRRATLRMRFRVQYLAPDGRWLAVRRNADSRWRKVGLRSGGRIESGWSFEFAPPRSGDAVLRGVVNFQWRQGSKVIRSARRITEGGHISTVGAAGGELYVWTVDDPAHIRRLAGMGVTGVISNDPRLFASA